MNKEICPEELKNLELDLLVCFHNICVKQHFRYSLGGGTLLGAVRHKGFIPWDDDIDVMMPRPDYNAFIDYCLTHEDIPFEIRCFENDKTYVDLSAKIYNPDTVLQDDNICSGEKRDGVFIDVFVIDGLGDTYKKAGEAFSATSFKRALLVASQWKRFFKSKTHPWYYEPARFIMFVLSRFVNKARLFKSILKKYSKTDFDKVSFAAAVGGSYREKEILPTEVFTQYIALPFEGRQFNAIANYDAYLGSIYGDYMQLPPEEKRVSHHTFKAYYKEDSEQ